MINLYYSKNLYTYINSKSRYSWLNILTYCFVTLNILKNYTGKGRREVLVSSSFRRRSVKRRAMRGRLFFRKRRTAKGAAANVLDIVRTLLLCIRQIYSETYLHFTPHPAVDAARL